MSNVATANLTRHIAKCNLEFSRGAASPPRSVIAVLADVVMQAGVSYVHVVRPRIERLSALFPGATTVPDLLDLIAEHGAESLLAWKHHEKPRRLRELARFFYLLGVDSVGDMRTWLAEPSQAATLRSVRGIGPKSVDYLKGLLGIPVVAVDRHLLAFARNAGLKFRSYEEVQSAFEQTADALHVGRLELDQAIWSFMSHRNRRGVAVARDAPLS